MTCVYIYIYIHIIICVCVYIYIHIIHVYIYTHKHMRTYNTIHYLVQTGMQACEHMNMQIALHSCVHS